VPLPACADIQIGKSVKDRYEIAELVLSLPEIV